MTRLIELRVRNFCRVSAVDIRPAVIGITPIKGENESGKTSTLDAFWAVIKGRAAAPPRPIRAGTDECILQASLSDDSGDKIGLVVTRKFTASPDGEFTQTLDVRTGEGVKITKTPQAMLDALAGHLGFDPLAFERAEPKKQFDMLRMLVPGLDFDANEADRKKHYAARTIANRQAEDAVARAAGVRLPAGARPQPVDVGDKLTALGDAARTNAAIDSLRQAVETAERDADTKDDEAERLRARAATLEREAAAFRKASAANREWLATNQRVDEAALREEIAEADRVKGTIALFEQRDEHLRQVEHYGAESTRLTAAIDALDKKKLDAIAAAKLPVDGLGLGDGEVTFKGLPFSHASAAIKMRTAVAVAMALNPDLKAVLVRDGSLLDKKSLAMLAEMATEHGFAVLLETIDTSMPGGFEIVDGANAESATTIPASKKKK